MVMTAPLLGGVVVSLDMKIFRPFDSKLSILKDIMRHCGPRGPCWWCYMWWWHSDEWMHSQGIFWPLKLCVRWDWLVEWRWFQVMGEWLYWRLERKKGKFQWLPEQFFCLPCWGEDLCQCLWYIVPLFRMLVLCAGAVGSVAFEGVYGGNVWGNPKRMKAWRGGLYVVRSPNKGWGQGNVFHSSHWIFCINLVGRTWDGQDVFCRNKLVFVKNGRWNAQCPRGFHPHFPDTVVFERSAKDPNFAIVFCESTTFFGLVVDEGFNADGDEGRRVVVVGAIHMGVGRYFRV